jgi:hypothetical protein
MKILWKAEQEEYERLKKCMERFQHIYWLSEFDWLTVPFEQYVLYEKKPLADVRDDIRQNFKNETEEMQIAINSFRAENKKLKDENNALKKVIALMREKNE